MLFISHSSEDKAAAEVLKLRALARGYSAEQIFIDSDMVSGVAAGADWEQFIYDRLKQCQAILVIYSPRWSKSKWCFAELVSAKLWGKQVFPIVIEACEVDSLVAERQCLFVYQQGEEAYERLWQALEQNGLGPSDFRPWPPKNAGRCPFPGLLAFNERFAPVYFGREPETNDVLEDLRKMREHGQPRLLMIVGGSGSGKSSLLRAGVLPRCAGTDDWLVLPTLRYGQHGNDELTLLGHLAQELSAQFSKAQLPAVNAMQVNCTQPDWKELRAKFESNDVEQAARDFFDVTQDLSFARGTLQATTLIAIDQFEELLSAATEPAALHFLKFLNALLSKKNGRLLVIGTIRSDYHDVYERNQHALRPPFLQTYRLPPFPWQRVTDVIVRPAARVGVEFSSELLERLKLDAPTSDALPLLAFTLEKMFRQCEAKKSIELRDYESLGGMTGSISNAVARLWPSDITVETEQAIRLSFVHHLAQVNEKNEFVRRSARLTQLPLKALPLIEQFINERLLHTSGDGTDATVEVSHEAIFRCWDRLAKWLSESSRVLRWRRDVERDTQASDWSGLTRAQLAVSRHWPQQIPHELSAKEIVWIKQSIRRERSFRVAVVGIILLVTSLAGIALYQRSAAVLAHNRSLTLLSVSSSENHANAVKACLENFEAKVEERWAEGTRHTSKWHEAIAFWCRSLEMDPQNKEASVWLYETIARNGPHRISSVAQLLSHNEWVRYACFSPDGKKIVTASGNRVLFWDPISGEQLSSFTVGDVNVTHLEFSRDGTRIVTIDHDSTQLNNSVKIWDAITCQSVIELPPFPSYVHSIDISSDGKVLCIAAGDSIQFWRTETGESTGVALKNKTQSFTWSGTNDNCASFSPDGRRVVTASPAKGATVWRVSDGELIVNLEHQDDVRDVEYSPDGLRIVTVGGKSARQWNADDGLPYGTEMVHDQTIGRASYSPDATRIVTFSFDDTARIWDAVTGEPVSEPLRHEEFIRSARYSPDGAMLVTASDKVATVWHSEIVRPLGEPFRQKRSLPNGSGVVLRRRIEVVSPSGLRALHGIILNDHKLQLKDPVHVEKLYAPLEHREQITDANFSSDSMWIVTASADRTARIWNANTGLPVGEPLAHDHPLEQASFAKTGAIVTTIDDAGTSWQWDVLTAEDVENIVRVSPAVIAWAGTIAGLQFNKQGELEPMQRLKRQLSLAKSNLPAGIWADLATWLTMRGPQRTLSPRSRVTVREVAERERDFGTRESLESALRFDTTVPLARMMLANAMELEQRALNESQRDRTVLIRAAFWRRYDLDRLPEESSLWSRAAEILRQVPDAPVGVGADVTTAADAATQADRRARELKTHD